MLKSPRSCVPHLLAVGLVLAACSSSTGGQNQTIDSTVDSIVQTGSDSSAAEDSSVFAADSSRVASDSSLATTDSSVGSDTATRSDSSSDSLTETAPPVDATSSADTPIDLGLQTDAVTVTDTATPPTNQARTITPFDTGWLFNNGDVAGADGGTSFVDTAWRQLSVPHDWCIEGPFSQNAPMLGRGGYLPSGVGWYRKHFTLPQNLSGDKIYIDFEGIMENSDVYINGTHLGHHPYGYVGLRYDMTSAVNFGGADNVIAVETNTTSQPAERFYAGAGIYRHVRLIVANPVHIDQWATYVATPAPTATAATVNVTTTVVNSGTTAQSVSLEGTVSDPSGTALAPVTTAAQTIAAGA